MDRNQVPPQLGDLFARYLQKQAAAQEQGLAIAEPVGGVIPHDAGAVQPVEPRLAWEEALAVLGQFRSVTPPRIGSVPTGWSTLVATHESESALPFAVGNYPQLVRNLNPLLQASKLSDLLRSSGRPTSVTDLISWAEQVAAKGFSAELLVALGAFRLCREYEKAAKLAARHEMNVPSEWKAVWANEVAALAWQRGDAEEALASWNSQCDSTPVLFNRGMASLFLGKPSAARESLSQAIKQLPDDSAWHHLGAFYLALAEMRG